MFNLMLDHATLAALSTIDERLIKDLLWDKHITRAQHEALKTMILTAGISLYHKDNGKAVPVDGPIESLKFSVRTYNCMRYANINTISDLIGYSDAQLLSIPHFGKGCLKEVREVLQAKGLT